MSKKLLKSTFVTGLMTLISRITGLVRDIIFAGLIGASAAIAADAFYIAFRIPNFFRRIFGEGAFAQAFVPVFTEYHRTKSPEQTRDFTAHLAGRFGLILFVITLAGVIAAPVLVTIQAPGYLLKDGEEFALTVDMLRITFPYLFFISLVSMAGGILNTHGRFAAAAFTPVLLNLSLILSALFLAPYMERPVMALAWGVFIAGLAQLLFQVPFLLRLGMLTRPKLKKHEGTSRVFGLMIPAIFGSSVSQINMVVNTVLASFLATGSVSWLYYSDRLMEFPLGVFGIALATVILPSLSRRYADGRAEHYSAMLEWALHLALLIALPAAIGLAVLAGPIITTLFFWGSFNAIDVEMTAQALVIFAAGLPAFILVKVMAPGFYARHDTRTPAKVAIISFSTNIVLSLVLVLPFQFLGLALAISLSAYLNAGILYWLLRKQEIYRPHPRWWLMFAQIVLASAVMGLLIYKLMGAGALWLSATLAERILRLVILIGAGLVCYVAVLLILGLRPRHLMLREIA